VYLAPYLGYSDMVPKLIISSGFIMSGSQLGKSLAAGGSFVPELVAVALGVGLMVLVQPAVASLVSSQVLQALLLGPACAVVAGLIAVAIAEALLGAAVAAK